MQLNQARVKKEETHHALQEEGDKEPEEHERKTKGKTDPRMDGWI